MEALLSRIEAFARATYTPIIKPDSWEILHQELIGRQPSSILEIGTAIGYSAIKILSALPNARLVGLEIRLCRAAQAKRNLTEAGLNTRAEILQKDAVEYLCATDERFDFVFLDGPKGQYGKYLPMILGVLSDKGWIFADNLNFDGRVPTVLRSGVDSIPRKHRAAVKGLIEYREGVFEAPFRSVFYEVGDGVAVSALMRENGC